MSAALDISYGLLAFRCMVSSLNMQVLEERVLDRDARLAILGAISIAFQR
jgi:hypothetical protein